MKSKYNQKKLVLSVTKIWDINSNIGHTNFIYRQGMIYLL